jgi:TPR repeat protein
MNRSTKLILATLFLLMSAGCTDHLQEGIGAYKEKNYAAALKELQPLADKGNAEAQVYIGFMYDNGEGLAQDYRQAVLWYGKSAEQGNANAQYNLGMMYANGLSVPQDWVQALKWFNLAAFLSGDPKYVGAAKQVEGMITPEQVKAAWALSTEWKEKHK